MSDKDINAPVQGRRKDGKPYKVGNTRADGSYRNGKNRAPTQHQFAKNDGRKRGSRPKGQKNLLTEWREELAEKITITEGGVTMRVTKLRGLIKSKVNRGIKSSDRAAETSLRYAELSEKREPGVQADDLAIIEAWLEGRLSGDNPQRRDDPSGNEEAGDGEVTD